jgi:hypothetical protein
MGRSPSPCACCFPLALRRILHGWQRMTTAMDERHDTPAG